MRFPKSTEGYGENYRYVLDEATDNFRTQISGEGKVEEKGREPHACRLRNLAPVSAFNPAEKWEKEKEKNRRPKRRLRKKPKPKWPPKKPRKVEEKQKGGGGGGKNKAKISKADEIRAKNKQDHANKDVSSTSTHNVSS